MTPAPNRERLRPLSHHDILGLVAPFSRRGCRVDLAASERSAGRLRFESHGCRHAGLALRETLCLHCLAGGRFRLVRTTTPEAGGDGPALAGLHATLEVDGASPAGLLERLEEVPVAAQWRAGEGYVAALCHRLGPAVPARLAAAELRVSGLAVTLAPPPRGAGSARIELRACGRPTRRLPEDLLAVLGWGWSPLTRSADAWRASVRLGRHGARHRLVEERLMQAAPHLARSLAEPPQAFHRRLASRRFGVLARRCMPLALCAGVAGLAAFAPELYALRHTVWPALAVGLPAVLLAAFAWAAEPPWFAWPSWPRALPPSSW